MRTVRVDRYVAHNNYTHDLSSALGIVKPDGLRREIPLSPAFHELGSDYPESAVSFESVISLDSVTIGYETIGFRRRVEKVRRTEEWGDNTVEFVDYWFEDYHWLAPTIVNGQPAQREGEGIREL